MYVRTVENLTLRHPSATDTTAAAESAIPLCPNFSGPSARYSAGPCIVPIWYARVNNTGTIYSGNRHYLLRTLPQWMISFVPSDFTGTLADNRHDSPGTVEGPATIVISYYRYAIQTVFILDGISVQNETPGTIHQVYPSMSFRTVFRTVYNSGSEVRLEFFNS